MSIFTALVIGDLPFQKAAESICFIFQHFPIFGLASEKELDMGLVFLYKGLLLTDAL